MTILTTTNQDPRFIRASHVAKRQLLHFALATLVPLVLSITWFIWDPSITSRDLWLFIGMWMLTGGLGVSVGYHRYFTHASFEATPLLQGLMAVAGSMAAQGPITYWVAIHRCHHQMSDDVGDPHSPQPPPTAGNRSRWHRTNRFLHGHMGWVIRHDVPSAAYFAKDLLKNRLVRFFDRTYWNWVVLGIVLPGIMMFVAEPSWRQFLRGCMFGGVLRILIGNQIIWSINSVCHACGARSFNTQDHSTNNWWLAIPTFGEAWHNNHHAFPWSARFGLRWWQLDLGWIAVRTLAAMGLASRVKQPDSIAAHRRGLESPLGSSPAEPDIQRKPPTA